MDVEQIILQPGQTLFEFGQPADTLYQLVDGTLTYAKGANTKKVTPKDLFMGFLDPAPYFNDKPYMSMVKAESMAILVGISHESRLGVIRNYPELMLHLYRTSVSM